LRAPCSRTCSGRAPCRSSTSVVEKRPLIDDLDTRHGGLKGRLLTPEGGLHRFVNIYVNDEDVRFLGSLDATLNDGDSITILPAVAGGALGFAAAAALLGNPSNHPGHRP
jgi:molybdopterin synthase sulfur carrier subunit